MRLFLSEKLSKMVLGKAGTETRLCIRLCKHPQRPSDAADAQVLTEKPYNLVLTILSLS